MSEFLHDAGPFNFFLVVGVAYITCSESRREHKWREAAKRHYNDE